MNILLIQPPQWYPVSPHLAVPLLKGQLINNGLNARALDLNVKFFNEILTDKNVSDAIIRSERDLEILTKEFASADFSFINQHGSYVEKTKAMKFVALNKFYSEHGKEAEYIRANTDRAVRILKSKDEFFIPEKMSEAMHIVRLALRFLSMPYAPNEIDLDNYFANPIYKLNWEAIKNQVNDRSVNMFIPFLERKAAEISKKGYDAVCICLTDLSQLIPVFTLCRMLKEKSGAKIIIGGNYATQIYTELMKYTEIFRDYLDFISIGDGERALCELSEYIAGKRPIEKVTNLVYRSSTDDSIVSTGITCPLIDLNETAYADFSDYEPSEYFTPEPVYPVQLSKGCYWGKCSFCDYHYGQQGYHPKSVNRIIDELKCYGERYGAKKFIFIDECIPPVFYDKLALAIIQEGLDIRFYSFARLEDGFTPTVLNDLYLAGARMFLWGYECHSHRVMRLMNKGISTHRREQILQDARNVGIWNNGLFIFGYPTETEAEIRDTMKVIRENRHIINSVTLSNFALKKHSPLTQNPKENGIISYSDNGELYTVYKDEAEGISSADRRKFRRDFQFAFLDENADRLWSVVFSDFDHLLLYLSRYGADYVENYRSDKRIAPEFR